MPAFETNDLAIDANGDVRAATVHGAAHLVNGKREAAVPSTSGMSNGFIYAIAVKGAPSFPAASEQKTTTISGRAIEGSQPLANTEVELCSEEPGFFKYREQAETPCGNQFFHTVAQARNKGMFRFENVPTGVYTLALKDKEGRWTHFLGLDIIALEPNTEVQRCRFGLATHVWQADSARRYLPPRAASFRDLRRQYMNGSALGFPYENWCILRANMPQPRNKHGGAVIPTWR